MGSALRALRQARLFHSLSDEALARLAAKVERCTFAPGSALMREGEPSDVMYVLVRGRAWVERRDPTDGRRVVLAQLGRGQVVGEMGVLDGQPRSATVRALTSVEALKLASAPLAELMVYHPEVSEALRHIVSQRLRNADALASREFTGLLRQAPFFNAASNDALARLSSQGRRRSFAPGAVLMRQGEPSDCLHVIARGAVRVERWHRHIQQPIVLAHLGVGEVVGEMGVLDAQPRSATVVATNDVETMEFGAAELWRALACDPGLASALLGIVTCRVRAIDRLIDPSSMAAEPLRRAALPAASPALV